MPILQWIDEANEVELTGVANLLIDSVENGASVNFVQVPSLGEALSWWETALTDKSKLLLVAKSDADEIVGCVMLMPAPQPNAQHRADVGKLLVHSSARRQGIAAGLMTELEARARSLGKQLLILDTESGSYAETFYRNHGWSVVGEVPNHSQNPDGKLSATTYFYKELQI